MTGLHLTEDELFEATGFRHRSKIAKALSELGVHFRCRPADGLVLVLREHYLAVMSGGKRPAPRRKEPNWPSASGGIDGLSASV